MIISHSLMGSLAVLVLYSPFEFLSPPSIERKMFTSDSSVGVCGLSDTRMVEFADNLVSLRSEHVVDRETRPEVILAVTDSLPASICFPFVPSIVVYLTVLGDLLPVSAL